MDVQLRDATGSAPPVEDRISVARPAGELR